MAQMVLGDKSWIIGGQIPMNIPMDIPMISHEVMKIPSFLPNKSRTNHGLLVDKSWIIGHVTNQNGYKYRCQLNKQGDAPSKR